MRAILCIAFLLFVLPLSAQEDCLNGIDDDGDGLVDLNDEEDCDCVEPISLLIFEDYNSYTCCPTNLSGFPGDGIDCLEGGWSDVGASPDYFNTCGYLGGTGGVPPAPQPFPSEGGVVGAINSPNWNEYIGYCLPGEMLDLESYTYSMYIGFNDMGASWNSIIPTEIGIYGTTDCSLVGEFNPNCLENTGSWDLIESFSVGGTMGEWTYAAGTFLNTGDYTAIAFGHICQDEFIYTFYDDFSIEGIFNVEAIDVDDEITEAGDCINGITLSVALTGYNYQWYLEGVAIIGATGMTYDVPPGQEGHYQVLVYDSNGCGIYDPYPLIINENILDIDADIMDVQCYEDANGSISLNLNGGNQPYDVMWQDGNTSPSILGLTPGNYPVTITDANGCIDMTSFNVGGPTGPLEIEISDIQQPKGLIEVATATVSVTGGTTPYDILWENQETGPTATNLMPGIHSVTVTDANGCIAETDIFTVHPPLIVELSFQNISCFDCDGSIDVVVSGGLPDYTIDWNTGSGNFNLSDLCEMEYTYLVTDAFGTECFGFQYIESNPTMEVTETYYDEFICFGTDGGDIEVFVTGGTPDYSYLWSNGEMDTDISGVPAGNYTLQVTDAAGCTTEAFYSITALQEIEIDFATVEVDCSSGLGGEISLFIGGGLPNYTVDWDNSMTGTTITGLSAGNYTAVVTDANGCTAEIEVFLSGSSDLSFSPQITNASCAGVDNGSIAVDVQGTGSIDFLWEDNSTENTIDSLSAGSYTLIVTDESGCTTQLTYEVETDDDFELLATQSDTLCFGEETGFISLEIVSGTNLSFLWDNGLMDQNLSNLTPGDYSVVVADENMCEQLLQFTIEEAEEIIINPSIEDEACLGNSDGSISLVTQGGSGVLSYLWEDGTMMNTISGISEGIYSVTVTDDRGCQKIDSFDVEFLSSIEIDGVVLDAGCGGEAIGSIDLILTGGAGAYNVEWDSGQMTEDIENLGPGDYTVVVTDDLGCMSSAMFTVGSGANLVLAVDGQDLNCFEDASGIINITLNGGSEPINYFLNGVSVGSVITNLTADSYLIEVIDADGCETSTTIVLNQPPLLEANVLSTIDVDASGFGSASISVQGGVMPYNITWDNGELGLSATMLTAGTHLVTIIDANGCPLVLEVEIGSTILAVDFVFTENVCFGDCNGTVDITVLASTGQVSYAWDNGAISANLSNLCNGQYTCLVEDEGGNSVEVVVNIESNDAIGIIPTVQDVLCFVDATGSIDLDLSGGSGVYTVFVNGMEETGAIENLPEGMYVIEVLDDLDCVSTIDLTIGSPSPLVISGTVNPISCNGLNDGSIDINISGGTEPYSTTWANGVTDSQNLPADIYELTVIDDNGCSTTASFEIEALDEIQVDAIGINPNCEEAGFIQIFWNENYPILLNGEVVNISSDGFITNLTAGNYQLSYLLTDNCEIEISEINLDQTAFLLNGITEESYALDFGQTQTINISELEVNGEYTLEWILMNNYTCTDTDVYGNCINIELLAEQNEQIEILLMNAEGCSESFFFDISLIKSDKVYIPNIIGTTVQQNFKMFAQSDLTKLQTFEIYDRWGEKVYLEKDVFVNSMEGWNLQLNQKNVLPGVYVYYAKVEFPDGSTEILAGDITVIF